MPAVPVAAKVSVLPPAVKPSVPVDSMTAVLVLPTMETVPPARLSVRAVPKLKVPPATDVAALAESVSVVPRMVAMVVPVAMPGPVTVIPAKRPVESATFSVVLE